MEKFTANWLNYCPNCGSKAFKKSDKSKKTCGDCKKIHYLNPAISVGAIILKNNQILLGKRSLSPFKNYWDIPGGFVEPDEHPHTAIKREIKEETGLTIEVKKQIGFYPDIYGDKKGKPTLNIHFVCSIAKGKLQPSSDVSDLRWFSLSSLPKIAFKNGLKAISDLKRQD